MTFPHLAYYSIAAHLLLRDEIPRTLGRGGPGQIPTVLLARLALGGTLQGTGLGGALLADARRWVIAATETVAARFVVVDAIDDRARQPLRAPRLSASPRPAN